MSTQHLLAVLPRLPDNALTPLTVRINPVVASALMQASMVRKFQQQAPWSQCEMLTEALEDWLKKYGMPQMADYLQHYVSWLIGRMIQALGFGRHWTLRDAWNYWVVKANYVSQSLPTKDGESTHLGLLMSDVFTGKLLESKLSIWHETAPPEAAPQQ